MIYRPEEIPDKKGDICVFRSLNQDDAAELIRFIEQGTQETQFFPWAPGESELTADNAAEYIIDFENDERRLLLGAFIGSRLIGLNELSNYGECESTLHRCTTGTAMLKEAQGRGLGKKLTLAVMDAARELGYEQLECSTATINTIAAANLRSMGFQEYGMTPHKRKTKDGGYIDELRFVKWL